MWEQIRANRRRSVILLLCMAVLLLLLGFAIGELWLGPGWGPVGVGIGLAVFLFQLAVYAMAAESILLHGSGARELQREDSPRLFNVVEEMQIASGLGFTPRIYLIEDPAPNAFALGRKPETSGIVVTTGLLYRLNRDELQGVIAHETGHLVNQDVKFMTLAGVMIGSIVILSDLTRKWLRYGGRAGSRSSSRSSGSGGGQAQLIIMLVCLVIIIVAPILAQILYFASSRKREYLADACAAQYTRYPEGIASALEKISRAATGLAFATRATAPMYIVNPLHAADAEPHGLFSTHPPTHERIRLLRSMSGAAVGDYEASFRKLKHSGVIGQKTLSSAPALPVRQPSTEGPLESAGEARAAIHRLNGYVTAECGCGMTMRIPENFENDEINCIRCGSRLAIPTAQERFQAMRERIESKRTTTMADAPPLQYQRQGTGWETFRCACGGALQLSPRFSASRTSCPKCQRRIEIV